MMDASFPRPEYPRPQFRRQYWQNLNGEWQFEIDSGDSGLERGLSERELKDRIVVPFCPESKLSGVEHLDFMHAVWYRREIAVPPEWNGQRVILHFGAVDHDATVWLNGVEVAEHRGGFTPFSADITDALEGGRGTLVVRARDSARAPQARGKQSTRYASHGCFYTRTTGIWQTVWMEPVPEVAFKLPRITPDLAEKSFHLETPLTANRPGVRVRAVLMAEGREVATAETGAALDFAPRLTLRIPEAQVRMWEPGAPFLYDLTFQLLDGEDRELDRLESYCGLRALAIDGQQFKVNGKAVFQRLVLDQGYYPEGIMTAPSDDALVEDIKLSMQAGFNGARLHQKVFEPRFLYHADRLGYLVWGEFGDWGAQLLGPVEDSFLGGPTYITQWLEALHRDYSHPSIIGWCGINEQEQPRSDKITQLDDICRGIFLAAKAMDSTRPVLDASGWAHRVRESDLYDCHYYITEKDFDEGLARFKQSHARTVEGEVFVNEGHPERPAERSCVPYAGQPYFPSEVGGFVHVVPGSPGSEAGGWGYGVEASETEDFFHRFESLMSALQENAGFFGYCYTQLTDIPPELNGIFTYDRRPKFDLSRLHAIQQRKAACEEG